MTLEQLSTRPKEKIFFKVQQWEEKTLCWVEKNIIYNLQEEALKAAKNLNKFRIVKRTDKGWQPVHVGGL
jgi:hypothetical protein